MATEESTRRRSRDELERAIASPIIDPYDYVSLTYVAAGNGAGKVETATFKQGGASGTTVAIVTLAYDANDKLQSVTKTDS